MNGYRKMISCNIPKAWDIALRWCKCRQRWIERVYSIGVAPYNSDVMHSKKQKEELKESYVKRICNPNKTSFRDTLELDRLLNPKDIVAYNAWMNIVEWVEWFRKILPFIRNDAKFYYDRGERGDKLALLIAENYSIDINLSKHILTQYGYEFT